MKKLTSVLLSVVMLMSVLCVPTQAVDVVDSLDAAARIDDGAVIVEITASEATTNGKFIVTWDADKLTYDTCTVKGTVTNVEESGSTVTVSYAAATSDAIAAGEAVIEISFQCTGNWRTTDVLVTAAEFNEYESMKAELPAVTVTNPNYQPTIYTVTFDMNGHGDAIEAQSVTEEETATEPAAPTAEGYVFGGWYTDAECTTEYDFTTAVNADITLYAKWSAIYTVTFDMNGRGEEIEAQSVTEGETATEPTAPTAEGYNFGGWYTDADCTVEYDFTAAVTADVTLYAKWIKIIESDPTPSLPTPGPDDTDDEDKDDEDKDNEDKDDEDKDDDKPGINLGDVPELTEGRYNAIVIKYPDVKEHWAEENIVKAINAGLFNGTGKNTFSPDMTVTRSMFVTLLYRLCGEPEVTADANFTDVPSGQYYTDAVAWASANGIVNGTSATTFSPDAELNREQMVTMLYRFAKFIGDDLAADEALDNFGDTDKVSNWAEEAMNWAVDNSIINGSNGNLNPNGDSDRAQIATVLVRYAGL